MTLHELLDWNYGVDGADARRRKLEGGADPDRREGPLLETPLHIATRRRRPEAVQILLDRGAEINATNGAGKTAYAHAVRRGFDDVGRHAQAFDGLGGSQSLFYLRTGRHDNSPRGRVAP